MANEFVIKNGFHSRGDSQITGSIDATGDAVFGGGITLTDANYDANGTAKYRVDGYSVLQNSSDTLKIAGNNYWSKITYGNEDTDQHAFTGNITASSYEVSASSLIADTVIIPQPSGSTKQQYKATPYFKTVITNTGTDQIFFIDDYIELYWDDSSTDDIELTIKTNPSSEEVHVIRENSTNDTTAAFDLQVSDGRTALDPEMGNDDKSNITMWAPSDSNWPFYRITVQKSNSTNYTNTPAFVLVERFV